MLKYTDDTGVGSTGINASKGTASTYDTSASDVQSTPKVSATNAANATNATNTATTANATTTAANAETAVNTSNAATNASEYLDSSLNGSTTYQQSMSDLYDRIMNREPFQYSLNGDALYNEYKEKYVQQGQRAMQDTMGQAQAMTGGYGNSYATTAGEQAYQQYLTQLNDMVPTLYDKAYQRYQDEGTDMTNKFNLAYQMDEQQYNREQTEQQNAYTYAMTMLAEGMMPSEDILALAGISYDDAYAYWWANGHKKPTLGKNPYGSGKSSGSSSSKSSGSSSGGRSNGNSSGGSSSGGNSGGSSGGSSGNRVNNYLGYV